MVSDLSDSESSTGSSSYRVAPAMFRCHHCCRFFRSEQAMRDHQRESEGLSDLAKTIADFIQNPQPAPPPPPTPPPPKPYYEPLMRLALPAHFLINSTVDMGIRHPADLPQPSLAGGFQRYHPYRRQINPPFAPEDHDSSARTVDFLSLMERRSLKPYGAVAAPAVSFNWEPLNLDLKL